ncbi:hypothetical protein FHH43_10655 [Clostridium perfringens]|nr:hypothetical protein [Clostridium perfringens]
MKKLITILLVVLCFGLGGWAISKHYTNLNEERFNNIIENANKAIDNQEYKTAEILLEKAKLMDHKTDIVCKKIGEIERDKEQNELYDEGLQLKRLRRYSEAIDIFNEITDDSNGLKGKSEKEIEDCKKCIIDDFSNKANRAIERGDIEKAKYIVVKIERVDNDSPEINILNTKIENFKLSK